MIVLSDIVQEHENRCASSVSTAGGKRKASSQNSGEPSVPESRNDSSNPLARYTMLTLPGCDTSMSLAGVTVAAENAMLKLVREPSSRCTNYAEN